MHKKLQWHLKFSVTSFLFLKPYSNFLPSSVLQLLMPILHIGEAERTIEVVYAKEHALESHSLVNDHATLSNMSHTHLTIDMARVKQQPPAH
jgi:hypothetical protein